MLNLLLRNIKWRLKNKFTIVITILQPLLWLILYSTVANSTMKNTGIDNYTAFILPGIMFLVSFSSASSGGIINFLMKSNDSFYRILISPVKRYYIVLSQILETVCVSFFEILILYITSIFFSVNISSGILGIIFIAVLIFLLTFFISSIAYTISLCLPNEIIYETIMTAIVLPIFFLSTSLFPEDNLSKTLKIIVNLNPITHIVNSIRHLILEKNIIFSEIITVITFFIILCTLGFILAMQRLKKETL